MGELIPDGTAVSDYFLSSSAYVNTDRFLYRWPEVDRSSATVFGLSPHQV